MTQFSRRPVLGLLAGLTLMPKLALGQTPLRIEINEGVIEPVPFAIPDFVPENGAGGQYAQSLARVIAKPSLALGMTVIDAKNFRPKWPWVVRCSSLRWLGE